VLFLSVLIVNYTVADNRANWCVSESFSPMSGRGRISTGSKGAMRLLYDTTRALTMRSLLLMMVYLIVRLPVPVQPPPS
jgi:hypothetical protein